MKAAICLLAAALGVVVGCADGGERDGSAGPPSSASETSPWLQPAAFADVVNSLCEQRYAAIHAMGVDVMNGINFLGVSDETTSYAVNALGVVRDQIPYLRTAPSAPQGWDALVDDYEQRADASNVAAGDGDAVAFVWYDPFRDLDARAYQLGATACSERLYDGTTRTVEQERYAIAANSICVDLLHSFVAAWFATSGQFAFGAEHFEPYPLTDDRVEQMSPVIADGWAAAEPDLRAIATSGEDTATVAGLIDAIDTVMAVFPSGDLAARTDAVGGQAFQAIDDIELQRYGLLPCTFRYAL